MELELSQTTKLVGMLDAWIENLINCKPLAEEDVRQLCNKVKFSYSVYQHSTK